MGQVNNRQYTRSFIGVLRVDGSAVTTSDSVNTGLTVGEHLATIKKGSGGDANLVTITFVKPFGLVPVYLFQPETLDCECRLEEEPTLRVVKVRTLKSTNLATAVNDADFSMLVFGTEDIREGGQY